jgi:dTDP-4-dehydrorhamnose 3,5-epimerase
MPMPVTVEKTDFEGLYLVKTGLVRDERGFFAESYSRNMFHHAGLTPVFVQDNLSESAKGTLRGMHYQLEPDAMIKLVRCIKGAIYDVVVDLRRGSPTFGKWYGTELSEQNGISLWVPTGFAHGFLALEEASLVHYKCTNHHAPNSERSLSHACPKIGIHWPFPPALISAKDVAAPNLDEAEFNFIF